MEMAFDTIGPVVALTAVLAFLWNLHRDIGGLRQDMNRDMGALRQDISDLRDRVSRVEGMLAGSGLKINPDPASG